MKIIKITNEERELHKIKVLKEILKNLKVAQSQRRETILYDKKSIYYQEKYISYRGPYLNTHEDNDGWLLLEKEYFIIIERDIEQRRYLKLKKLSEKLQQEVNKEGEDEEIEIWRLKTGILDEKKRDTIYYLKSEFEYEETVKNYFLTKLIKNKTDNNRYSNRNIGEELKRNIEKLEKIIKRTIKKDYKEEKEREETMIYEAKNLLECLKLSTTKIRSFENGKTLVNYKNTGKYIQLPKFNS